MSGFWAGKRILVTGHTGFKGSWLSLWLNRLGADVTGFALAPDTTPALFEQLDLATRVDHHLGDIRDMGALAERVRACRPDVVFHLAAQPLVLASYEDPLYTWSTNVMGTAHLLEALLEVEAPCAAVLITTDKVYENREWVHPYRETDRLGGHDPYSASKAGSELVIASYRKSFFKDHPVRLAAARAGNVIGGGDWASNRILPDLARAFGAGQVLDVRNPGAVRPWQHVLEPLSGYLILAERLLTGKDCADSYNFGPEPGDVRPVRDLVDSAVDHWPGQWQDVSDPAARHEAGLLALSIEQARRDLGYCPRWDFAAGVKATIEWYRDVQGGSDPLTLCEAQIAAFEAAQ